MRAAGGPRRAAKKREEYEACAHEQQARQYARCARAQRARMRRARGECTPAHTSATEPGQVTVSMRTRSAKWPWMTLATP
eukprot:6140863-Pleurochrysis_carterae.AAC.1